MDNIPVSFTTLDYIDMLSLGQLDMVGIRQLCVLEDVDQTICDPTCGNDVGGNGVGVGGSVVQNVDEGAGGSARQNADEGAGGENESVGGEDVV